MTPDYSQLPTPELNKLIHKLSVESRNRYETKQALLACGVERAKPAETQRELEKLRQEHRAGLDNDPEVLRTAFNHPIKFGGKITVPAVLFEVDALTASQQAQLDELHKQIRARWNPTANIDAIMTEADKLCARWEDRINNIDAKASVSPSEAIPDAE